MAVNHNNLEAFKFFWEHLNHLFCKECSFISLFRFLAKKDKPEFVKIIMTSKQTRCLF